MRRIILSLLLGMTISFLLTACGSARVESAREGIIKGEKAQDFTLKDLKGNSVSLSSFFGKKILVLDFSTTWCPHCITVIPTLKDIHTDYKDVEVMAVYIRESKTTLEEFTEKHNLPYTVLLDIDGAIASKYGIRGVPTVIVIDKDGIIKYRGHHISGEVIEGIVKE